MDDWRQQVVELIERGQKIEAIKVYREATGQGLAEAKVFIEHLEESLRTGELPPGDPFENLSDGIVYEIRKMVREGNKLAAIKRYRELKSVSLHEASQAVAEIAGESKSGGKSQGKGCAVTVGVLVLFAGLILTLWVAGG